VALEQALGQRLDRLRAEEVAELAPCFTSELAAPVPDGVPVPLGLEADGIGHGEPRRRIARPLPLDPLGERPSFPVAPTDDGAPDVVLVLGFEREGSRSPWEP
jgi:hypothetical protein